ncbi:hypothetical protein D3C80_2173430 [compost metagenome]
MNSTTKASNKRMASPGTASGRNLARVAPYALAMTNATIQLTNDSISLTRPRIMLISTDVTSTNSTR